jgi:hypothetical protein
MAGGVAQGTEFKPQQHKNKQISLGHTLIKTSN